MDKQALINMAGTDECMNPATIRQATKDLSLDDFRFVLHATRIHKLILDGEMDRAALAASQLGAEGHRAADGEGLTLDDFMPKEDAAKEKPMGTIKIDTTFSKLYMAYNLGHSWYATPTSGDQSLIANVYCAGQKRYKYDFLAITWEEWEDVLGFDLTNGCSEPSQGEDFEVSLEIPDRREELRAFTDKA